MYTSDDVLLCKMVVGLSYCSDTQYYDYGHVSSARDAYDEYGGK